jgi:hypothetical protein
MPRAPRTSTAIAACFGGPRAARLLAYGLLVGLCSACGIDAEDLARWKEVQEGKERLTGYLAQPSRALDLRIRAARHLIEVDAGGQVVHVVRSTTPEDRKALLEPLLVHLGTRFATETPEEAVRAKDVLYALLPFVGEVEGTYADEAIEAFVVWGVPQLFAERPPAGRPVEQVLLAAGLARPAVVGAALVTTLQGNPDPAHIARVSALVDAIGHVPTRLAAAGVLLQAARRSLPTPPEPLLEAIAANGNETLLRFLLDAARDPEIAIATRARAVDLAVEHLGRGAIPGLEELLRSEDPIAHNAMRVPALLALHRLRGPGRLEETLTALPDGTGWPDEGDEMRVWVDRFCTEGVAPGKAKARKDLLAVATTGSNHTGRIFAARCIRLLYPDEAREMLAPLANDRTRLRGFGVDPPPTLGDLARGRLAD